MIASEKYHGFLSISSYHNHKECSANGVENMHVATLYRVYLAVILNEAVYGVKNYANPGECYPLR